MTAQYIKLTRQIARQQPELLAYQQQIAAAQPAIDTAQAALDAATATAATSQAALTELQAQQAAATEAKDQAELDRLAPLIETAQTTVTADQQAATDAQAALAAMTGPRDVLAGHAESIAASIAACQAEIDASGMTMTPQEVADHENGLIRAAMCKDLDDACAEIYTRVGRFSEEYKSREADALAYQAAGYVGPVPRQVAAFATPAGITAPQATAIILSQAAQLRGALAALGELRMRKYTIKTATMEVAAATRAQALAEIKAIGAAL